MDVEEKCRVLLQFYERTRGIGHSIVLRRGFDFEKVLVLASSFEIARAIVGEGGSSSRPVNINQLSSMPDLPLMIDNSFIIQLCQEVLSVIGESRDEECRLQEKLSLIRDLAI